MLLRIRSPSIRAEKLTHQKTGLPFCSRLEAELVHILSVKVVVSAGLKGDGNGGRRSGLESFFSIRTEKSHGLIDIHRIIIDDVVERR